MLVAGVELGSAYKDRLTHAVGRAVGYDDGWVLLSGDRIFRAKAAYLEPTDEEVKIEASLHWHVIDKCDGADLRRIVDRGVGFVAALGEWTGPGGAAPHHRNVYDALVALGIKPVTMRCNNPAVHFRVRSSEYNPLFCMVRWIDEGREVIRE